jgi:hypothetical protein
MEEVTMLSKMTRIRIRSGSSRLRYGVVPLAVLIALVSSIAASAAVRGPAFPNRPVTYVNLAKATEQRNYRTDYSVQFALRQTSASNINADDTALARTSRCNNCGAIAIAFQVVFSSAQSPITLNENATAQAIGTSCGNCSTLAEAYQIVDAGGTQPRLTRQQLATLDHVGFELKALRNSGLSVDQIESEVTDLANEVVATLQSSSGSSEAPPSSDVPAVSPALNGPALSPALNGFASLLAPLTEVSQPNVQLYYQIQTG